MERKEEAGRVKAAEKSMKILFNKYDKEYHT